LIIKQFPIKFVVYYNTMPDTTLDLFKIDPSISCVKDGVKAISHQDEAPRLTLTLHSIRRDSDKTRYIKMVSLLEDLAKRGEIIGYKLA